MAIYMKNRNRRPGGQKERMGIIAASVFVLSALTLTGVYFSSEDEPKQEENVIDFAQLEKQSNTAKKKIADINSEKEEKKQNEIISENNDMDVDPYYSEVNSNKVENERPRFTREEENVTENESNIITKEEKEVIDEPQLVFDEKNGLKWPIVGKVLLSYSMDKAIYFPTMQQYKYNPSIVIAANVGETITAAADGKVKKIYNDTRTGQTVTFDIGNGYELTYGQLDDLKVKKDQFVKAGEVVGKVANPTIYYAKEGSNIYFMLTKDNTPVNPLDILK